MEHLALEVFDRVGTGSQYAVLEPDANITITDTSEIFAEGDVWSYDLKLNVHANAHLFGTAGDIHGSRLHEQIDKRKARLWVEGVPLYLGYLKLGDEAEVDAEGNVDVSFESGQKTFDEMIEGTSAQEVSVGDVVIGVALNRKRVSVKEFKNIKFTFDGLEPFKIKDDRISDARKCVYNIHDDRYASVRSGKTPYVQQWPKLVKSCGTVYDESWAATFANYTNVQNPYDASHPFCNINVCYQMKVENESGEEQVARDYTLRLGYSDKDTTDGGDNQTRYNNAPNFYLLYFIDRLFKDLKIHIDENQMMNVEDLRRVFMLNFGCHYEEIESASLGNNTNYLDTLDHLTPSSLKARYGQYYLPIISKSDTYSLVKGWKGAGQYTYGDAKGLEHAGKVLMRNVVIKNAYSGETLLETGSIEGVVTEVEETDDMKNATPRRDVKEVLTIDKTSEEDTYRRGSNHNDKEEYKSYSAYLAYATGDNYPNVEISEIIEAMKSMFGIRLLFSDDYKRVRIVLLRNVFRSTETQEINCEIADEDVKEENCIRGFRMTYGKGEEDTNFYYKGFADLFPRQSKAWIDTTDTHDYSQWEPNAEYDKIKQDVSAFNKKCYITPVTGNAYGVKVDEDEDVLYPSLFPYADFMDAEDGDCSGDEETIKEIQIGASPVIMDETKNTYAVLFTGDLNAPTPDIAATSANSIEDSWKKAKWLSTYGRITTSSITGFGQTYGNNIITGDLDIYISEGFRIRLLDRYSVSNGGTPFDEADPGLCFGIMRSSGGNAHVAYDYDPDDGENNDTWEVVPGDGAIDHPDTCDNYGNEWDYDGSFTVTPADAPAKLAELFPNSDAPFYDGTKGYITAITCFKCRSNDGIPEGATVLIATAYSNTGTEIYWQTIRQWIYLSVNEIKAISMNGLHMFIEDDSSWERGDTLTQLCQLAYGGGTEPMTIDDGVGSRNGRFSLKLRAEKPNPYFDPKIEEGFGNRRYLEIEKLNLRGRGLADQFYKEYSYWVRNARIVKRTVRMTLAQLLTIDKTKRVRVGDVTGFIRKMQYSVSNETGLGNVTMEIMYI